MNSKDNICKWYLSCPIKYFVEQGKLDSVWVEKYCLVGNKDCVRYQMEESGAYHPDNMLPNGVIKKDLSY
ncbi:MAG: uracil-DNA glycosylase [Promethearchaeota archaeon]